MGRPSRRWGYAAAFWSAAFAGLHLYWALGGRVGLAESAGRRLADERPIEFVLGGLYGVAALLVAAAVLGVVLVRGHVPGRRRLLPLLAAACDAVFAVPVMLQRAM